MRRLPTHSALLALALATPAFAATNLWQAPVSGLWTDAKNWSLGVVPQNDVPPGTGYHAFIDVQGSPYTVTVDSNVLLDSLTLKSPQVTLDHTGGTLTAGVLTLQGGLFRSSSTLRDAMLQVQGASGSVVLYNNTGVLNNVTLSGTLSVLSASFALRSNLTLDNAIVRVASPAYDGRTDISVPEATVLGGAGTLILDSYTTFRGPGTLTLGPGATLASGTGAGTVSMPFMNKGVISVAAGGSFSIAPTVTSWRNEGTISLSQGGLYLGGTFSTSDIGTVQRSGGTLLFQGATLNNAGAVLDLQKLGTVGLAYTTITGGTITGGTLLCYTGASDPVIHLRGVTLDTSLDTTSSPFIRISDGLTLTTPTLTLVSGTKLLFSDSTSLAGNSVITVEGKPHASGYVATLEGVTVGPGIKIRTGPYVGSHGLNMISFVNHGVISAESAGVRVYLGSVTGNNPTTWTNHGQISSMAGELFMHGSASNSGTITVAAGGSLQGAVHLTSAGVITLAAPAFMSSLVNGGTLSVTGRVFTHYDLVNSGVITVQNGFLNHRPDSIFANSGTINVGAGTLGLIGSVSNTGTISLTPSSVVLIDRTGPLPGEVHLNGATVGLTGQVNGTLLPPDLANAPHYGKLELAPGLQLTGGTLRNSSGSITVLKGPWPEGINLSDVTLDSNLRLPATTYLNSINKLTLNSRTITLGDAGGGAGLAFAGLLAGSGVIELDGAAASPIQFNTNFVLPAGITLRTLIGGGTITAFGTLETLGLVTAETAGREITVNGRLLNGGTLQAVQGSTLRLLKLNANSGLLQAGLNSNVFITGDTPGPGFQNTGTLLANGGTVTLSGRASLAGTIQASNGGSFRFSGSTLTVTAPIALSTGSSAYFSAGSQSIGAITGNGHVIVGPSRTLTSDSVSANTLAVQGTHILRAGAPGATRLNQLSIAAGPGNAFTATLDLTDNKLILDTADNSDKVAKLAEVRAALTSGRGVNTWKGKGITSSTAAQDPVRFGVNVFDNADLQLTSFGGLAVDAQSLLVTLAVPGDANLDWKVDAFDLGILASHWQQTGVTGASGDFTQDGKVDAFDLNVLAARWQFGTGGSVAAGFEAALGAFPQFASVQVPEPSSLVVLAGAGVAVGLRRRRQR